jgi:glucose-1-phosphate cytidylyltransferase
MKTVILCGGLGTRLSEETQIKPKPMVEIGGKPILWHIMKIYESHNINDFILALGYKSEFIKDYFLNYQERLSDFKINLQTGEKIFKNIHKENWEITLVDTGLDTLTGGRLLRLKQYLSGETFMLTYGDGVADVDISSLLKFHKKHGKIATVTSVRPPARFGGMTIDENGCVKNFKEKPQTGEGWINGGFFVFEPGVFEYLENDKTILEQGPLENMAKDGQLMAFEHSGYWQCMDTIRDRDSLQELWKNGNAPWFKFK